MSDEIGTLPDLSSRRRHQAARRALDLLYAAARRESIFTQYDGHLLLAFMLIGTSSRNRPLAARARDMGRERALRWRRHWHDRHPTLTADTVLHEVLASYAAERLGVGSPSIRRTIQQTVDRCSVEELIYFDPAVERVPRDVPEECPCGGANQRGQRNCLHCAKPLRRRSPYDIWYYALTYAYFCEQHHIALRAGFADVIRLLPSLRPYPAPGTRHYYSCIYAVTHTVYTLNGYGASPIPPRELRDEAAFLERAMRWALAQREPDTVGEIVDSLLALGRTDRDRWVRLGRTFLLETQDDHGGWGDAAGDGYAYFHTLWTAIDGLRDYTWQPALPNRRNTRGAQKSASYIRRAKARGVKRR